MPRVHFDLHYIASDDIDRALSLLLEAGLIRRSEKDVSQRHIRDFEKWCPANCAFIKVKSFF